MQFVIGIDVGITNLGMCVFDLNTSRIEYLARLPLVSGKYMPSRTVEYVREFVQKRAFYFENAARVLVERQMRANMRVIEAVFQVMHYDRCIVMAPRAVKMHYNISTGNYNSNKTSAVDWVDAFIKCNPEAIDSVQEAEYLASKKRDDMADAALLVLYYLDTYSNQLGRADDV